MSSNNNHNNSADDKKTKAKMAIQRSDKTKIGRTSTENYNSLREESSKSRSVVAGSKETLRGSSKSTTSQNNGDIVNKKPISTNGNPKLGGGGGAVRGFINNSVRKHASVGDHSRTPYSKNLSINKSSATTTSSTMNGNRHLPRESIHSIDGSKSGAIVRKNSNGKSAITRDSSNTNDHKKSLKRTSSESPESANNKRTELLNIREGSAVPSFKAISRTPRPLARPAPSLLKADTSRSSCDTLSASSHKLTSSSSLSHSTQKPPSLTNRTSLPSKFSPLMSKTPVSPSTQKSKTANQTSNNNKHLPGRRPIARPTGSVNNNSNNGVTESLSVSTIKEEKKSRSRQVSSLDEQRPQSRQSLSSAATLRKRPDREFSSEQRPAKRPVTEQKNSLQAVLRDVFGYDKRKYRDYYSDDDEMEVSGFEVLREEARSAKIGYQEDKREEMLERQRLMIMQQKSKTSRPLATGGAPRKGCK
ncbi:774_t:CDS:2 [Ambispora gerdemannii]|uniref:774_t:CDS:1 n=1 Tax=Ambispora gerdemannii TaxID=144530 RepID=A0A9N8WKJ9_9GLOM|nr:774_t:CDS:2 [Ambispora gerdemannii]